jgi:CRP-like cAMP-binding protein
MIASYPEIFFGSEGHSVADLQVIVSMFHRREFAKNSFLQDEGKVQNRFWLIESGYIRAYVMDRNNDDITTSFFSAGDLALDWASFLLRIPGRENLQALSDVECWEISFEDFQKLFHRIELFREKGRSRLVTAYMELKNHSISLVAEDAKSRYLQLIKDKPAVVQHVSLKHIASYLGVTDTSLSRIRKEIAGG